MESKEMFFVFGTAKAGTTFVQMLLNSHPQLSCPVEHCFIDILNGLKQLLLVHYNKLLEYGDQITARQGAVLFDSEDVEYLFSVAVKRAALKGARGRSVKRYGLKDNHFVFWLPLVEKWFPEARIISPVRDPRSVVVSGWHFNMRINPNFRQTRGKTIELWAADSGAIWKRDVEAILSLQKKYPERVLIIRYEDLRQDPENHYARLFEFLEVDAGPGIVKKVIQKTAFEKFKDGRFFRRGGLEEWKKELTPQAIKIIEELNLPLMKTLGYEPYLLK
ncbi:sulfotransferase domain-containing protein [Thermosulfurimonas marina]|uniref:Sulfotransferase domain-containing protein n=1 Tax=Thermosulfurimonas marina TaxID=2047767 RepID=A0A6H1WTP5_9BACT|nr:sulfotransferase domain-containing protein [Thermosulfurimonas marina]QJA06550.1 sulfotransferase domain-containing protein [Thermosulfurimonas marina]